MPALLPEWPLLSAFLVASLVLAVTPGPGVAYIVARSLRHGRASGLASVAGVALGNLANALAASLGLAALFVVSAAAFDVVKFAGAAYLFWLGVQALRAHHEAPAAAPGAAPLRRIACDGFMVALLNPKTALFFAAFLPQFMTPGHAPLQGIALGALFVVIAAFTDTLYALAAGSIAPRLAHAQGARRAARVGAAMSLFALALWTLLGNARAQRR